MNSMIQKRLLCAQESKIEFAYKHGLGLKSLIMGILTIKMPVDSVHDWVSCLHLNSASNTQTVVGDNHPVGKESSTIPHGEAGEDSGETMSNKPKTNKFWARHMCHTPATGSSSEPQVMLDQIFEEMLPQLSLRL